MSGKLFVIDGVDGSGKQTQTERLRDTLDNIWNKAFLGGFTVETLTKLRDIGDRINYDAPPDIVEEQAEILYRKLAGLMEKSAMIYAANNGLDVENLSPDERAAIASNIIRKIEFPTYTKSSALIEMYLAGDFGGAAGDVNPYAASTFYAVDRYASYTTDWGKTYESGGIILCDRYTTSNAIHQAAKLEGDERARYLAWLDEFEYGRMGLPRPDLVIFLDVPPDYGEKLLRKRYSDDEAKRDIHEKDREYMHASYRAAAEAAELFGWKRVKCVKEGTMRKIEDISYEILILVMELITSD